MARKRLFSDVESLENIEEPIPNPSIHSMITAISPVKKECASNYWDATFEDESKSFRLIGFTCSQHKVVSEFMTTKTPVRLEDCEIKPARRGNKMEVILKRPTKIPHLQKNSAFLILNINEQSHNSSHLTNWKILTLLKLCQSISR